MFGRKRVQLEIRRPKVAAVNKALSECAEVHVKHKSIIGSKVSIAKIVEEIAIATSSTTESVTTALIKKIQDLNIDHKSMVQIEIDGDRYIVSEYR